jgi:hypothetical protein
MKLGMLSLVWRLDCPSCVLTVFSTVLVGKRYWTGWVIAAVSGDSGCVAEPVTVLHEASVNLADVIVRTLSPDRAGPDRQHVEIRYCTTNPNGNDPLAKGLTHCLNCEFFTAKESDTLVQIGTEPQAGKALIVENIHRFLGAFLNDRYIRMQSQ